MSVIAQKNSPTDPHCGRGTLNDDALLQRLRAGQRIEIAPGLWAERLPPPLSGPQHAPKKSAGTENVNSARSSGEDPFHASQNPDGTNALVCDVEGCGLSRLEPNGQLCVLVGISIERPPLEINELAGKPASGDKPDAIHGHLDKPEIRHPESNSAAIQVDLRTCGGGIYRDGAAVSSTKALRLPHYRNPQPDLVTLHCSQCVDHAKDSAEQRDTKGEPLLQLNAGHFFPVGLLCNAKDTPSKWPIRLGWLVVALMAAVVVPLRVAEIHSAHADREAAKARWASSSSVRG